MDSDELLYRKLYNLRIRIQNQTVSERKPTVCTEDVLRLLVKYKPKNMEDLLNINGVGDTFAYNYGKYFIEEIERHTLSSKVSIDNKEKNIMSKLENRLVNINKRNRLLYSGKISKDCIDLYKTITDLEKFKNFLLNLDTNPFKLINYNEDNDKLVSILRLMKDVKKNENETGNNELYVAYPFVQGKLEYGDFPIKAPLMLFPVIIDRDSDSIIIKNDFSRDIIYNTTLILANNKFNGINEVLPENTVDEFLKDNYRNQMLKYYGDYKLYISDSDNTTEKFFENKMNEFPIYNNGQLFVKDYMVLGIYSTYVTSMYKDFHKMIENEEISKLIKELIEGMEGQIVYDALEEKENNSLNSIEDEINYINELDYSQEKVLKEIKNNTALVVEGPPGTGKSQVITSIIAQSILEGKNVLMVSEKKTALDVIYSRLGKLSKFALLIDDIENKDEFYKNLNNILETLNEKSIYNLEYNKDTLKKLIKTDIENINNSTNKLDLIANKIYDLNDYGISFYDMYKRCKKVDLNSELEVNIYNHIKEYIPSRIYCLKYNELESVYNVFKNTEILANLKSYITAIKGDNSYMVRIKQNLVDIELSEFTSKILDLKEKINTYNSLNLINKLFYKKNINSKVNEIGNEYFTTYDKKLKEYIINNTDYVLYIIKNYQKFIISMQTFNKLSNIEQEYFGYMCLLSRQFDITLNKANYLIFNDILYYKIINFEKANPWVFNYINDFDSIRNEIGSSISEKKELTKDLIYDVLLSNVKKINDNGKLNKIYEMCNRKRKMSLNRFMSKYRLELLDSVKVWLMTPEVVSDILPFEREIFDLVIFDEASQLYIEKSIPAIYRTKKIVIAGDEKQLKPSSLGLGRVSDEEDTEEYNDGFLEYESLLEASKYKFRNTMLEYHYRSKYEELISFSNYAFYNGKLMVTSDAKRGNEKPIERIKVENGLWIDKKNEKEADEVVKLVKKILTTRKNNESIGVITFNSNQMDLIEDKLEKEKMKDIEFATLMQTEENRYENGENISFFVKNIERVQGDERDIIIFCIGYAKNESGRVSTNFGWLSHDGGENRLNVAISRAKQKIYVITSIEPEELIVDKSINSGPKLFKKYLEYVKALDEENLEYANSILYSLNDKGHTEEVNVFESDFEEEVCNKLQDLGYIVETQYGVGGYRIDLVIKDKTTNENLLGIECDGKLYHSSKFARERDYHRQKYLESRGWKIYRIWSTNWWRNPELEIKKIDAYIKNLKNKS